MASLNGFKKFFTLGVKKVLVQNGDLRRRDISLLVLNLFLHGTFAFFMVSIGSFVLSSITLLVIHVLSGRLNSSELRESMKRSHKASECANISEQNKAEECSTHDHVTSEVSHKFVRVLTAK